VFRNMELSAGSLNLLLVFAHVRAVPRAGAALQAVLGDSALRAPAGQLPLEMGLIPVST
jgi:hypothetical protein